MTPPNSIVEIADGPLAEWIVRSHTPVLLAFGADGCPASQKLMAMLANAVMRYGGRVTFAKASPAKLPKLAARLGIASTPSVLLLRGGAVSFQFVGELSPRELDDLLAGAIRENFATHNQSATAKP